MSINNNKGQVTVFDFRWTVTYKTDDGNILAQSFYKPEKAQAFSKAHNGKIEVTSWQIRVTVVRDGKKIRLKPVFDVKQTALTAAVDFQAELDKVQHLTVQDLLSPEMAKDALKANRPEGWTFTGAIVFAHEMGYEPNLPQVTVEFAINEYTAWLAKQFTAGNTSECNLNNSTFALKMVRLYFKGQPVQVLLNKDKIKQFCEGIDAIPVYAEIDPNRKVPREDSTTTKRPWGTDMQRKVAAAISAMMNRYVRGRYVSKYVMEEMFWFPDATDMDPYILDFDEMRNLLNGAWTIAHGRHATRVIIELFGAVRPSEIDSWDVNKNKGSYLNLTTGIFYVDIRRKTGRREVQLPFNARLMLQILKKEGRLSADEIKPGSNCYRIRKVHPHTLTYFHARLGYRVGASTVSRPTCTAERFWELNPVKYEAGWPQDGRRHTCLDFYFYATDKDSGSTAGYAGHLTTEFFRNYKGKLIEQNIAAAVARYYRLMPDKYRHLETAKDEKGEYIIKLPAWYQIKDESELDNKIDALAVTLADLNLINYSLKPGCSAIPLNEFRMIENSWRVHYADENGKPAYKTLHKKPAVAALARKFKVVPDDQLITFPIEDAALKFVNGYKIEPWAWRIEGYVLINGVRTWLRPVRTNKQEAESLLAELRKLYPSEGGRSGA